MSTQDSSFRRLLPEVGSQLGPYILERMLGAGGMGVVYRVYDPDLDRGVALKVLAVEVAPSEKQLERFRREYEVVAQLRHPNVVKIHDANQHQGRPFFVQDLVEGPSLEDPL